MARFKPGQEVVCIAHKHTWEKSTNLTFLERIFRSLRKSLGPDVGEIVTVESYNPDNRKYMLLREYAQLVKGRRIAYNEDYFMPVADIQELKAILESVPESV